MTTVGEIVAFLREQGQLRSLVGDLDAVDGQRVTGPNADGKAREGEVSWTKRAEAVGEFGGSLLICSPEAVAGREARQGPLVAVCERPRLAMARVIAGFFSDLTADRRAEFA
ncbi:MAG TPA: hypothetical protein VJ787_06825, partial [Thermoleophilia bacterium]|nr:hypothetical protein [Thermoleophilia bacterium]